MLRSLGKRGGGTMRQSVAGGGHRAKESDVSPRKWNALRSKFNE